MFTRCSDHRDRQLLPKGCPTCTRIALENEIVTALVDAVLAAGYALDVVDDCGHRPSKPTTERALILEALMETDEDFLRCTSPEGKRPWVRLIYGNGADVISDYSMTLDDVLRPVNEYAELMS